MLETDVSNNFLLRRNHKKGLNFIKINKKKELLLLTSCLLACDSAIDFKSVEMKRTGFSINIFLLTCFSIPPDKKETHGSYDKRYESS